MSEEERMFLFDRCNVKNNTNITWFHHCRDGKNDQLAVTIVALMEQYLVNNGSLDDIPPKKIVWHEASHSIALRVAHHGF